VSRSGERFVHDRCEVTDWDKGTRHRNMSLVKALMLLRLPLLLVAAESS
jgi:hypothetical protein